MPHISFIPMARINPEKQLMTKWTAVEPKRKERHFIVTKLICLTDEIFVVACVLEAVINKNNYEMDWRELKDTKVWKTGWE
ncbi:MAG: TIGR02450 family Trp-rich protein [Methylomicrobium sp.]|nr:TIGR02450 family Trp-rich protein [Methylomicrobium sp.]